MRFRCPSCDAVFELQALPSTGVCNCPGCGSKVKVGKPDTVQAPQRPLPPDPDFQSIPQGQFRPQTPPAYLTRPIPPPPRPTWSAPQQQSPAGNRRRVDREEKNPAIWILLGIFGAMLVLGLLGAVGFVAYQTFANSSSQMTLGGYSVTAPGKYIGEKKGANQVEQLVVNMRTRSQFQIIYVTTQPSINISPEQFVINLDRMGSATDLGPANRAGLNGRRFRSAATRAIAELEGEVFSTAGGLIVITYQRGSDIADFKGDTAKYTGDEERSIDNPEQFFSSLRKAS